MELSRRKRSNINSNRYRQSNFELLRILSMYLIIIHHLVAHSGFACSQFKVTPEKIWLMTIMPIGKVGVVIFILLTGYFTYDRPFKLTTLLRIVTTTSFYSITIYIFALLALPGVTVTPQSFFQNFFPIISDLYWFATAYCFMYLLMPYLNKLATSMVVKQYVILILILIVLICIPPYLMYYGIGVYGFTDTSVMILVWFTGAFIKKYNNFIHFKNWKLIIILIFLFIMDYIFHLVGFNVGVEHPKIYTYTLTIGMYNNSLFAFITGVVIFLIFKNIKMKPNFLINYAATGVFAVYLIHSNNYIAPLIWHQFVNMPKVKDMTVLILDTFMIPFIILIVCLLIEFIRKIMFGEFQNRYIKFWSKIISKIDQIFTKFLGHIFQKGN